MYSICILLGDGRKSVAERELEVKRAELNREVAQMAEQLTRAATVILETEQNAIDATLAAQQACDEAQQVQVNIIERWHFDGSVNHISDDNT